MPQGRKGGVGPQVRDTARVHEEEAIALRVQGLTFQQMAERMGVSTPESARRAFERGITKFSRANDDDRQKLKMEQDLRLRAMIAELWPTLVNTVSTVDEKTKVATVIVRVMERVAKLHGLDAPVKIEITDQMDIQIEALLDDIRSLPAPTIVEGEVMSEGMTSTEQREWPGRAVEYPPSVVRAEGEEPEVEADEETDGEEPGADVEPADGDAD
jgi:hypothetical protein